MGGWAFTWEGVFKGGASRGGGGGGELNSLSPRNLPYILMFKQVIKYHKHVRFVNIIRVCQQSFCSIYFRIFQRKCDSAQYACVQGMLGDNIRNLENPIHL